MTRTLKEIDADLEALDEVEDMHCATCGIDEQFHYNEPHSFVSRENMRRVALHQERIEAMMQSKTWKLRVFAQWLTRKRHGHAEVLCWILVSSAITQQQWWLATGLLWFWLFGVAWLRHVAPSFTRPPQ